MSEQDHLGMKEVHEVVAKTGAFFAEQKVDVSVGITALSMMLSSGIAMVAAVDPAKGAELTAAVVKAVTEGSAAMVSQARALGFVGAEGEAA